jgi:hypothetical protein
MSSDTQDLGQGEPSRKKLVRIECSFACMSDMQDCGQVEGDGSGGTSWGWRREFRPRGLGEVNLMITGSWLMSGNALKYYASFVVCCRKRVPHFTLYATSLTVSLTERYSTEVEKARSAESTTNGLFSTQALPLGKVRLQAVVYPQNHELLNWLAEVWRRALKFRASVE